MKKVIVVVLLNFLLSLHAQSLSDSNSLIVEVPPFSFNPMLNEPDVKLIQDLRYPKIVSLVHQIKNTGQSNDYFLVLSSVTGAGLIMGALIYGAYRLGKHLELLSLLESITQGEIDHSFLKVLHNFESQWKISIKNHLNLMHDELLCTVKKAQQWKYDRTFELSDQIFRYIKQWPTHSCKDLQKQFEEILKDIDDEQASLFKEKLKRLDSVMNAYNEFKNKLEHYEKGMLDGDQAFKTKLLRWTKKLTPNEKDPFQTQHIQKFLKKIKSHLPVSAVGFWAGLLTSIAQSFAFPDDDPDEQINRSWMNRPLWQMDAIDVQKLCLNLIRSLGFESAQAALEDLMSLKR